MERGNEDRGYTPRGGEHLRCRFCRSVMRFPMKTNLLGLKSGLFWLAVALATGASSGNAAIIVLINGMDNPDLAASWNVPDVGWLYTPPFSYAFTSIGTKFGSADGRVVNAEIFSGAPGAPSAPGCGRTHSGGWCFCLHELLPYRQSNCGSDILYWIPERRGASRKLYRL
jgi:hypothetical protein